MAPVAKLPPTAREASTSNSLDARVLCRIDRFTMVFPRINERNRRMAGFTLGKPEPQFPRGRPDPLFVPAGDTEVLPMRSSRCDIQHVPRGPADNIPLVRTAHVAVQHASTGLKELNEPAPARSL